MGGIDWEDGRSIAVDGAGNVFSTGTFIGTSDFDPGMGVFNLTAAFSNVNVYISKLGFNGNFIWAEQFGGTSYCESQSIALDSAANVYITGIFTGTADFDPGVSVFNFTSAGSSDIFICKLDTGGNFLWAKQIGDTSEDIIISTAVDEAGNIFILGNFVGAMDFDPGAGTFILTAGGPYDMFIIKLNASGNFIWAKQFSGIEGVLGRSIAYDPDGNVYSTGTFSDTVDFDPGPGVFNLISTITYDAFFSKLDANGNFLWAKQIGGANEVGTTSIAVDPSYNIYTTGAFNSTVDFDPGAGVFNLTADPTSGSAFINKLDSGGNFIWAKQFNGTILMMDKSIAIDDLLNVYINGNFFDTLDFDLGAGLINLIPAGQTDIFICKLDPNGNYRWVKQLGGTLQDWAYSIAVDQSENVYTTGYFNGTSDFDPGIGTFTLMSFGSSDIFIHKMNQKGVTGYAFNDLNGDCVSDYGEIGINGKNLIINPGNLIVQTAEHGYWHMDSLPAGNYTVTADTTGNWLPTCQPSQTFTIINPDSLVYAPSFGFISTMPCASPDVSIHMPFMRPCFSNQIIYVNACNQNIATGILDSAYVDVELDNLLTVQSATLAYTDMGNNIFRFDIGTLNPGMCTNFSIACSLSCTAVAGQTICIEANLYPADSCVFDTIPEFNPTCSTPWDKSSLMVESSCVNDTIVFIIYNTGDPGDGDMTCYSPVRIYIDGALTYLDSVMLAGGDSELFIFSGDGRTWRLEVDQHPLHPGNSHPNATVELCGNFANWTPNLVNVLPMDDADPITDIYCGVVTASYDPNDKRGYPLGVTDSNYIAPNQPLQYVIRFQNTGTDTAFSVVIRDTLDLNLNIFSVTSGVASHSYNFMMHGPRVLEWTFNNILLPDSNTNEPTSHGFVTFMVNQKPDLPDGTNIRNSADIYFDYNAPVITNQTIHTVYEGLKTVIVSTPSKINVPDNGFQIYPNPNNGIFTLQRTTGIGHRETIKIYNIVGEIVYQTTNNKQLTIIEIDLSRQYFGVYFVQVVSENEVMSRRLVIE